MCTFGCRYAKQRALQRADALKANVRVVKQQPTPVLALLLQSLFSTQVSNQLWKCMLCISFFSWIHRLGWYQIADAEIALSTQ